METTCLVPLHDYKQYKDECADILNEEWPRSKTARLHMLQKSSAHLPYSIVMIEKRDEGGDSTVIGHSRLCVVHGRKDHAFIDAVLVKRSHRGRGHGKTLMKGTEDIARKLGLTCLYLTTHDKQDFYAHIGYRYCDPIITLGGASNLLTQAQMEHLFPKEKTSSKNLKQSEPNEKGNEGRENIKVSKPSAPTTPPCVPPPPPPPPPPPHRPPPPVSSTMAKPCLRENNKVRMDPSKVFWMCKDIS